MKEIPVDHATLHQAVTIKGHGPIERTLHKTRIPGIQMSFCPDEQVLKVVLQDKRGVACVSLIPSPNVGAMHIMEPTTEPKAKKVVA